MIKTAHHLENLERRLAPKKEIMKTSEKKGHLLRSMFILTSEQKKSRALMKRNTKTPCHVFQAVT